MAAKAMTNFLGGQHDHHKLGAQGDERY